MVKANAPFKFLARLVLAITLAGVAAKANAQSIDELYQAAKKEGSLSLNGGGLAGLYEPWVREFEQRFPGVQVKLTAISATFWPRSSIARLPKEN